MPRIWIVPLFVVVATSSGWSPANGQAPNCNLQTIGAQLAASNQVPSLRGCSPADAQSILGQFEYGLSVARHVHSAEIPSGLIVGQRVQAGTVFVDVSTGPALHGGDGPQNLFFGIVNAIVRGAATPHPAAPPPAEAPPAQAPAAQPTPAPESPPPITPVNQPSPPAQPLPDHANPTPAPVPQAPPVPVPAAPAAGPAPASALVPATHGGGQAPPNNQIALAGPVAVPHVDATVLPTQWTTQTETTVSILHRRKAKGPRRR